MRISDVVQNADLSIWAEAALVLFLGAFIVVAARALRTPKKETEKMAAIPLEDELAEEGGRS